jgi:hypothetical protein
MKHLLSGVAILAVLAIAAPVWAQSPSGGNSVGAPGPSPGGPGLTPYSGGAPSAPPAEAPAPAPMAMPPSASAPPAPNSAMPPTHRQAMHHHYHHGMYHHAMRGRIHHGPRNPEDTTAQLNRAELGRIQSGNIGAPPPASEPGAPMGPSSRMPGPKTNGSGYIPPAQ